MLPNGLPLGSRLFIHPTSNRVTSEEVRSWFEPYGPLAEPISRHNGFSFVQFTCVEHASAAFAGERGRITEDSRALDIRIARPEGAVKGGGGGGADFNKRPRPFEGGGSSSSGFRGPPPGSDPRSSFDSFGDRGRTGLFRDGAGGSRGDAGSSRGFEGSSGRESGSRGFEGSSSGRESGSRGFEGSSSGRENGSSSGWQGGGPGRSGHRDHQTGSGRFPAPPAATSFQPPRGAHEQQQPRRAGSPGPPPDTSGAVVRVFLGDLRCRQHGNDIVTALRSAGVPADIGFLPPKARVSISGGAAGAAGAAVAFEGVPLSRADAAGVGLRHVVALSSDSAAAGSVWLTTCAAVAGPEGPTLIPENTLLQVGEALRIICAAEAFATGRQQPAPAAGDFLGVPPGDAAAPGTGVPAASPTRRAPSRFGPETTVAAGAAPSPVSAPSGGRGVFSPNGMAPAAEGAAIAAFLGAGTAAGAPAAWQQQQQLLQQQQQQLMQQQGEQMWMQQQQQHQAALPLEALAALGAHGTSSGMNGYGYGGGAHPPQSLGHLNPTAAAAAAAASTAASMRVPSPPAAVALSPAVSAPLARIAALFQSAAGRGGALGGALGFGAAQSLQTQSPSPMGSAAVPGPWTAPAAMPHAPVLPPGAAVGGEGPPAAAEAEVAPATDPRRRSRPAPLPAAPLPVATAAPYTVSAAAPLPVTAAPPAIAAAAVAAAATPGTLEPTAAAAAEDDGSDDMELSTDTGSFGAVGAVAEFCSLPGEGVLPTAPPAPASDAPVPVAGAACATADPVLVALPITAADAADIGLPTPAMQQQQHNGCDSPAADPFPVTHGSCNGAPDPQVAPIVDLGDGGNLCAASDPNPQGPADARPHCNDGAEPRPTAANGAVPDGAPTASPDGAGEGQGGEGITEGDLFGDD